MQSLPDAKQANIVGSMLGWAYAPLPTLSAAYRCQCVHAATTSAADALMTMLWISMQSM